MERIDLPAIDERGSIFCAFLLLGHKVTYKSWNDITGLQGANQRADDLRRLNLPLYAPQYKVEWCKRPIAVYQFKQTFIDELGERGLRFIDRVQKHYADDPQITKGLQSKPQPLKSILAGKLDMERD